MKFFESQSELLNNPACFFPKAIMIAPVRVDNYIIFLTLYFYWVQFMQSASTSRPQASVLPIQTVIPFLDFMMSRGRQELELTKFQTKPIDAVTFAFRLSLAILYIELKIEAAPCLSICISLIPEVGFKFRPPESKHTPLPIKAVHSQDSGFPLQLRLIKIGYFQLALPTACINLNPQFNSQVPLITVNFNLY